MSCHSVLEYLEVKLFTEAGHNVISLGAYLNNNKGTDLRGEIAGLYQNQHLQSIAMSCSKENIHPELLEWADVVVMMHNSRVDVVDHPQPWLGSTHRNSNDMTGNNWEKFNKAGKPVIWRSIGQSNKQIEEALQPFRNDGLKIVRYSPKEKNIPSYCGEDAMIRFPSDPDEFNGYVGSAPRIVNVSQAMFGNGTVKGRGDHMAKDVFDRVVDGFDWKIFGPDNDLANEHNGGLLSYGDLKTMLSLNRVYFYCGTRPASYTLGFQEALMSGIPVVSIGPDNGNKIYNQKTFEAHELIGVNGEAGYWSDDIDLLREYCGNLLQNQAVAQEVGAKGRLRAIELFGKDMIKESWRKFFETL
jgi:hypothetical protein